MEGYLYIESIRRVPLEIGVKIARSLKSGWVLDRRDNHSDLSP